MALQRINSSAHRERIAACAQWIVDAQCPDGEWGYPGEIHGWNDVPAGLSIDPPKADAKKEGRGTTTKIPIKRRRLPDSKAKGDISNTQFALLGLKACEDAGFEIPKATWQSALAWHLKVQQRDGGWGYHFYGMKDKASYGSMTCAGVCAVAISKFYLGSKDPSKDASVRAGLLWLAKNWTLDDNPGIGKSNVSDPGAWHYYYLYSIERVGKLVATEKVGSHDWYAEGADWLLKKQKEDGSWFTGLNNPMWKQAGDLETADTCFAILFLSKSTPPLVASGGGR